MALNEKSANKDIPAILGENTAGGFGVFGKSDLGIGVHGENGGGNIGPDRGVGVWGESQNGFGLFGSSDNHQGVRGVSKIGVGVNGINERPATIQPDRGCGVHGESINGFGVCGTSDNHEGVRGASNSGVGVFGSSDQGEGMHAETNANNLAAIAAFNHSGGAGAFVTSRQGEGVHAETSSINLAAIAAFMTNPNGVGAAIHAENRGKGVGVFAKGGLAGKFEGNVEVTGNITTHDVVLSGGDCAEEFDIDDIEKIEPGTVMVINETGALEKSQRAYDKRVAGVISGAGKYSSFTKGVAKAARDLECWVGV